jgi:hypothetical protein
MPPRICSTVATSFGAAPDWAGSSDSANLQVSKIRPIATMHALLCIFSSKPNALPLRRGPLLAVAWSGWFGSHRQTTKTSQVYSDDAVEVGVKHARGIPKPGNPDRFRTWIDLNDHRLR